MERRRRTQQRLMPGLAGWAPVLLGALRIVAGLGFALHGTDKLFGWPDFGGSPDALTVPLGLLETIGGAALAAGTFTRAIAFVLAGEMAVAYWWVHAPAGFFPARNGGEAAMLYCFVFLYLATAGGGAWSLEAPEATRSKD